MKFMRAADPTPVSGGGVWPPPFIGASSCQNSWGVGLSEIRFCTHFLSGSYRRSASWDRLHRATITRQARSRFWLVLQLLGGGVRLGWSAVGGRAGVSVSSNQSGMERNCLFGEIRAAADRGTTRLPSNLSAGHVTLKVTLFCLTCCGGAAGPSL